MLSVVPEWICPLNPSMQWSCCLLYQLGMIGDTCGKLLSLGLAVASSGRLPEKPLYVRICPEAAVHELEKPTIGKMVFFKLGLEIVDFCPKHENLA